MVNKRITRRVITRGVIPIVVIGVIVPLLLSQRSFAFDKYLAHPSLTQEVVEFYNASADRKITPQELEWIKEGSTREDDSPRWANHFYDAVHERGLTPKYVRGAPPFSTWKDIFGFALPAEPVTSLNWAENDQLQALYGDNRTWQKGIEVYDSNRHEAMLNLGAVLHLVEDLGVPEHARGDSHMGFSSDPKSYYEEYTDRYLAQQGELNIAEELVAKGDRPYKNGTLDRIFRGMSLFTENRWFSEDTIRVQEFSEPKIAREIEKDLIFYYSSSDNLIAVGEKDKKNKKILITTHNDQLDFSWIQEAFPEIVKYGANTVQLYFDEVKKREQDPTLGTIDRLQARDSRVRGLIGRAAHPELTARIFLVRIGWHGADIAANVYQAAQRGLSAIAKRITGNVENVTQDKAGPVETSLARVNEGGNNSGTTDASTGGTSYEETLSPKLSSKRLDLKNIVDQGPRSNDEFAAPATESSIDEATIEPFSFGPDLGPSVLPPCNPETLKSAHYGQRSEAVLNVKACLAELSYSMMPSNYYGQQTIRVIKDFYEATLRRDTAGRILGAAGVKALHDAIIARRTPAVSGAAPAPTPTPTPTPTPAPSPAPAPAPINFSGGGGGGGNTTPNSNSNTSCSALAGNTYPKVVISEFQYESANDTKDEFIELYNPNDTAVDLRCFQLNKFTSGSRDVPPLIPASKFTGTIPARGFFLITHPSVANRYGADLSYAESYSIAKNNSLFLVSAAGRTLDLVGYGDDGTKILAAESAPFVFVEPTATTASIERLNLQDTDNNSLDFWLNYRPNPENSHSPTRIPRTDFVDLRGITLTNLNASFDQEASALSLSFHEPVLSLSPANYEYQISFSTTSPSVGSPYALSNFGSTSTIPAPVFQAATFALTTSLTQCPETTGTYIVTVALQDRLASSNRTSATTSLDLTPFCNPAGANRDHSGDSVVGTQIGPIRISEILIASASSTQDEYVELYNPNNFSVNLAGFSLVRVTRTSTEQTILPVSRFTGVIQPFSFFLLANELANIPSASSGQVVTSDLTWAKSYNLARDNAIKLLNASGTILDLVGWGTAPVFEGTVFPDSPTSSAIQRKAGFNSTLLTLISAGTEQSYGNAFDTDNNASDFILAPREPQTAASAAEPPPLAPTNLTQTLNTATVTLTFVSPYRPTSTALSYELRKTSSNLSDTDVQTQWATLTSVSASLPSVRIGGYNESVSFRACSQVSQNDYLLLGVVRGGALVGFARVQLTGSPSCAQPNNLTLNVSDSRTNQCDPVIIDVTAQNLTSSTTQMFNPHGLDLTTTASLSLSQGQTFFHSVRYGNCAGSVSDPIFTYTLTASGVDSGGVTVDLTNQLSGVGTSVPANHPTDYLTTGSLIVPTGYRSIKFSFVGTQAFGSDRFHFPVFTETLEVVTQ